MGACLAFLSFHGSLFPEGKVALTGFSPFACGNALAVALLFHGQFAGFCLFVLGVFQTLADAVGVVVAGGYDDNYVLPTAPGVKLAAVLTNGRRTLRVLTDAPGLQVYTGDYLPLPRGGVALEAQNFPDSPHNPHFLTIELRPGQVYARTIAWEID